MFEKLTLNDPVFNVQNYPLPSIEGGVGGGSMGPGRVCSLLIIHCSATLPNQRVTVQDIDRWHRQRGFDCIGYHFYITVDGTIWVGRPLSQVGAHCKGYNAHSIGICYEGGLIRMNDVAYNKDTRTPEQVRSLYLLITTLLHCYPTISRIS